MQFGLVCLGSKGAGCEDLEAELSAPGCEASRSEVLYGLGLSENSTRNCGLSLINNKAEEQ